MRPDTTVQAFSSEAKVKAVATKIIALSDTIHETLRRLASDNVNGALLTPYALLTEEYALRFRANILITDAARFVISSFKLSHDELMNALSAIEEKLNNIKSLDDLSELLSALTLFSNSIVSKKKKIILFLFEDLVGTK